MNQEVKDRFWKRQFSEDVTSKQNWFDIIFGIIAPILCLVFDPIVFRDRFFGGSGSLGNIRLFAYLSIGFGIIVLAIWLSSKLASSPLISAFSGIFSVGGLLASVLGIVLLPMIATSLMIAINIGGLLFVIGIFGLLPFFTAFVFLRNGVRAFRKIQPITNKDVIMGSMAVGIALVVGVPLAANWGTSELVSRSVYTIVHSDQQEKITSAVDTLQFAFWCSNSCYDEIVWTYAKEKNEARKTFLAEVYLKLTNEHIEQRLRLLRD